MIVCKGHKFWNQTDLHLNSVTYYEIFDKSLNFSKCQFPLLLKKMMKGSFLKSVYLNWCLCDKSLSLVWFFATLWSVALQAALSTGFSRQEYWSGLLCPPPGDVPKPRTQTHIFWSSCIAGRFFTAARPGKHTKIDTSVCKVNCRKNSADAIVN